MRQGIRLDFVRQSSSDPFSVAADFDCAAAPVHPGQDCEFVFVLFAGESFFGHGVGCGNAATAGYVVLVEAGCLVNCVFVFVK